MKVNRTKEGTIFELICGLLILVMWIVAFALFKNSPDTVPTHFDIAGNVDATGDKIVLLVMAVVGTIATATVLLAAYKPDKAINIPFTVSSPAQYTKVVRMARLLAVEMALLFIVVILMIGGKVTGVAAIASVVAVMILTTIVYCVKIYRLKDMEGPVE